WNRDGFHVEYVVMFKDDTRFMLVHPITGNLKTMLDTKGPGTIYRYCFTTPDMTSCYEDLVAGGVQPENENGVPLPADQLKSPVGTPTIWLPKQFGDLSMEILEEEGMEASMARLRTEAANQLGAI